MQVFKEGLRTAIKASYRGRLGGPTIAFVGELDALPEIGHGCGHNMIAVSDLGAAVAVRNVIRNLSGTVEYIGAPAEERYLDSSGGKVIMLSDFSTKRARSHCFHNYDKSDDDDCHRYLYKTRNAGADESGSEEKQEEENQMTDQ